MKAANKNKIVRTFVFDPDFVSCNTCALNYAHLKNLKGDGWVEKKIFCQEFSIPRDPQDTEGNMKTAHKCPYWNPENATRAVMSPQKPEHERWYEKDSMA